MAKENSFLLVSLEEGKAKKLAQVISNDTSRKILDALAKQDATETELSKSLHIPLSTIHYNLKALVEANLVRVDEYHYSPKGKEVNHYRLANKYIIIAPKESSGLKKALHKFLPITLISVGATGLLYLFQQLGLLATRSGNTFAQTPEMAPALQRAVESGVMEVSRDAAVQGVGNASEAVNATVQVVLPSSNGLPFPLWFLFGSLFVILLYAFFELLRAKRNPS